MPDYQKGKIYQIICPSGLKYIGSTTTSLVKRFSSHKQKYRCWKEGNYNKTTSFILFEKDGLENSKIELIEYYPCDSKKELEKKEGEYIMKVECVNKILAGREWTSEYHEKLKKYWNDYHKNHREHDIERYKKYQEKNKEKIKEMRSKYYNQHKDQINEKRKLKRKQDKLNKNQTL